MPEITLLTFNCLVSSITLIYILKNNGSVVSIVISDIHIFFHKMVVRSKHIVMVQYVDLIYLFIYLFIYASRCAPLITAQYVCGLISTTWPRILSAAYNGSFVGLILPSFNCKPLSGYLLQHFFF
jgi:hypothetical protein